MIVNTTKKTLFKSLHNIACRNEHVALRAALRGSRSFSSTTAALNSDDQPSLGRLPSFAKIKAVQLDKYLEEICKFVNCLLFDSN